MNVKTKMKVHTQKLNSRLSNCLMTIITDLKTCGKTYLVMVPSMSEMTILSSKRHLYIWHLHLVVPWYAVVTLNTTSLAPSFKFRLACYMKNFYSNSFCLRDTFLTLPVLLIMYLINTTVTCDKLIRYPLHNYVAHRSLSEVHLIFSCTDVIMWLVIITLTDIISSSLEISGSGWDWTWHSLNNRFAR